MLGKLLKWPKQKREPFTTYEILIDQESEARKEDTMQVNNCVETIESGSVPVVIMEGVDISKRIVGAVICTVNEGEIDRYLFGHRAYILLDNDTFISIQGIKRRFPVEEAPNGYSGYALPIWHLMRAADINCPIAPPYLSGMGKGLMDNMKKTCKYVYEGERLDFWANAGLGDWALAL